MDSTAALAAGKFIEQGLLGAAVVALVIALCLCVRHIIKLYDKIGSLQDQGKLDALASLSSVTTALNTVKLVTDTINAQHKG